MLNTFAHNGHDHIQEVAQVANNSYTMPALLIASIVLLTIVAFLVIKRKKK